MIATTTHNMNGTAGLANRLRGYFDRHPEISHERFLLEAIRHEIDAREPDARWYATARQLPRVSEADARWHAWLNERLTVVNRRRNGFWAKVRRFFLGGR